ncbi:hypothetical protein BGZ68_002474 [Mortierella alpina]|nr:hypothetical protein BGZ68_002474 [Mortierella alpina]
MRHWSDFLDLNLLRPSAFERRHIEVQRHQQAHQRHSSTSSLPHNLPSRFASFTAPVVSYNLDPANPLNASHLQPRQSLDGRRRHVSAASLSSTSQQPQPQQQPSTHTSFFSTRVLTPPASSGDGTPPPRFTLTGGRGRSRGTSVDDASNTSDGEATSSRRSFLRPFFNRNSSWNGQSASSATPSSMSTSTRTQSNASRTTTTTGHSGRPGQDVSNDDGNESEEERQRQQRSFKFMARPTTGIDMTPRTDRMRRRTHVDDEDLSRTAGAASGTEGATEVIVSVPLTIADTPAATLPEDGVSEGTGVRAGVTTAVAGDQADSTGEATTATTHDNTVSRTTTRSATNATASTRATPTSVLQRPSLNESRTLTLPEPPTGLIFQRQPTPAERRIQRQLSFLKKFMCVIATMPIIATLAVHNKIEVVMWWVLALPLVGIAVALVWRRRLAIKLQRLQEETDLSRLSLAFAPTQSSTTRVPRHNQDNDDEPPPPPDYQSSIITPPAYIVAQQPRKVPSYRSLENLFAFARNGSRIFSRGTAAAAANDATTAESGAEAEGEEGGHGEGQQEEGGETTGENYTADTEHPEDPSNNTRNSNVSVVIHMPQDSVEPHQESEQTVEHSPERKTEESIMPQEKTEVTTTTTPLTAITVVPRVEIEFVQPQAYQPQALPEMVEVAPGLGSHPTDQQHLHQYQGTRSFVSTTSSSGGSSSTAHDTMHELTLVDSFDGELQTGRRPSLHTVTSLEEDWETDQDTQSAESSSLAHARYRSRDIKGKAPSRE